jgi:multimeric flavodoxin WrbA
MAPRRLLVVAHVPSRNTRRMTEAVIRGASNEAISGVEINVLSPFEAGPEDVGSADAVVLGTTENFGYMSGAMKDFFDRIYYPCLESTQSLPYALFIRAGNDGRGARRSVEGIVSGLGWRAVQAPLICRGPWQDAFLGPCEELGATLAAGLEAGIF